MVRAIAIAAQLPYRQVHDELQQRQQAWLQSSRSKAAQRYLISGNSTEGAVAKDVTRAYLQDLGWLWTPTVVTGVGCRIHMREAELPMGRIICALSRHYVAVIDHVIHDVTDPSQNGTRSVYGYWEH